MRHLLLILVLTIPTTVSAQELTLQEGLTQSILDLTTTERRHLWWTPCNERFRGHSPEAHEYASNIAAAVIEAAGDDLDPWWMVAQLAQESGLNPCMSSVTRQLRQAGAPTNVASIINHQRTERVGVDMGIAQFRWPGTAARRHGITRPEELFDMATSMTAFSSVLRSYRSMCETRPEFRGIHVTSRGRTIYWNYSCDQYSWAIHNTGSIHNVRYQYITNVTRRYQRGPERWRARFERGEESGGI